MMLIDGPSLARLICEETALNSLKIPVAIGSAFLGGDYGYGWKYREYRTGLRCRVYVGLVTLSLVQASGLGQGEIG